MFLCVWFLLLSSLPGGIHPGSCKWLWGCCFSLLSAIVLGDSATVYLSPLLVRAIWVVSRLYHYKHSGACLWLNFFFFFSRISFGPSLGMTLPLPIFHACSRASIWKRHPLGVPLNMESTFFTVSWRRSERMFRELGCMLLGLKTVTSKCKFQHGTLVEGAAFESPWPRVLRHYFALPFCTLLSRRLQA